MIFDRSSRIEQSGIVGLIDRASPFVHDGLQIFSGHDFLLQKKPGPFVQGGPRSGEEPLDARILFIDDPTDFAIDFPRDFLGILALFSGGLDLHELRPPFLFQCHGADLFAHAVGQIEKETFLFIRRFLSTCDPRTNGSEWDASAPAASDKIGYCS